MSRPSRLDSLTLIETLDDSLKRLGVERIELDQIHYLHVPVKVELLIDALSEAAHAGKVRVVGWEAAVHRRGGDARRFA